MLIKNSILNQLTLRFACILFCLYFSMDPLKACKLWAVCTKAGATFPTLSLSESKEIENQLTSFFHQSETLIDGWSLLGYGATDFDSLSLIQRSSAPAIQDSNLYWSTVETLLSGPSNNIGLGHLRLASSGTNAIQNPHPWIFYMNGISFSLIHNGTVNKSVLYDLITNNSTDISWLESNPPQTFGGGDWKENGWTNVVDSELILLLLMQHVEQNGDILSGLESTLTKLINAGVSASQLNMIFSDGETLFAFGGSERLYYAEFSEHYAIMTTPSQSIDLSWTGIGHQELLRFSSSGFERYPNFVSVISDEEISFTPKHFSMGSAYPNPFNGSVNFSLNFTKSGLVNISIISVHGKLVDQFSISVFENDSKIIRWEPKVNMATGTYFVRAKSKGIEKSQKILFIK